MEGHEARVLAGATALLARGVPFVAEVAYDRERELAELHDLLDGNYTHYLDLVADWEGAPPLQPMATLPDLPPPGHGYSDVLFLRL